MSSGNARSHLAKSPPRCVASGVIATTARPINSREEVSMRLRSVVWSSMWSSGFAFVTLSADRALFAQTARPLAIEDFYRVKTAAAPSLSPDARWVSFIVGSRIEESNGTQSEVWLVPSDASVAARKVSGSANATAPRWADDGRLQFSSSGRTVTIDPNAPERADTSVVQAGAPATPAGGRGAGG